MAPKTAVGGDAIRWLYEQRFPTFGYGRQLPVDEILDGDQVAAVRCHSTGTLVIRESGKEVEATAREILVLVPMGTE